MFREQPTLRELLCLVKNSSERHRFSFQIDSAAESGYYAQFLNQ